MRFQDFINEKITRREFDTVLDRNEVNCGCEFEFYFEAGGSTRHPDAEKILRKGAEADEEAKESEKFISDYYNALDKAEEEKNELLDKKDDLSKELSNAEFGSPEFNKIEDKIADIDSEIDDLDRYIEDRAWEEYAYDFPSANTMPAYASVLNYFENEFGMDMYGPYDSFDELSMRWIEDQEVPSVQETLGFSIEDFFEEVNEGQGREFTADDLEEEDFPFNLYKPGWEVETDPSLNSASNGVEIITPTVKINELLNIIEKVFDWISKVGYTDDETCGFHVHMSLDTSKYELDPLKLIMFVEEGKIYQKFEARIGNRYAQSIAKGHLSSFAPFTVEELRKVAKKEKIEKNLNTEKFLGLHLIELEENHVEFRYMGAKDYETKFTRVRDNIVNYAYWLSIACDPDFKKKEYIKKLQRRADQYNWVFIQETINKFKNRLASDMGYRTHEKMTGITYTKYQKLLDRFVSTKFKKLPSLKKPPKNLSYHKLSTIVEPLVNKKVQDLKKEFTEKVKKVT